MLHRLVVWFGHGANFGSVLLGTGVLSFTLGATRSAQAEMVPVRAELEAPEGCPDADWFLQQILKRAPSARAAAAAEAAQRYRASVRRDDAGFSGEVESEFLARTDASQAKGKSCEDVVATLAMTVALSLDADPIARPQEAREPVAATQVTTPSTPERGAPAARAVPAEPAHDAWILGVSAEGAALGAGVPLLLGGNVNLLWRMTQPGAWAPMLSMGGGFLSRAGEGDVGLRMPLLIADACPSLIELGPLWLTPCAHNLVGFLRGQAVGPRASEPVTLLLAASGLGARLEWVSEPLLVVARGSVLGVWSAPTFRSQPSGRALLQVERVAVDAGVGLGLVF